MKNKEAAQIFINAIKSLADKPDNLDNLQMYLERHFDKWLEWCRKPADIATEMKSFAEMEV